jgi:quercetin dioxygenase-like cupin family protein
MNATTEKPGWIGKELYQFGTLPIKDSPAAAIHRNEFYSQANLLAFQDLKQHLGWQPKVWGRTRMLARGFNFEVHELEVKKGGFCSCHRHEKWNGFHVVKGELIVELRGNLGTPDTPEVGAIVALGIKPDEPILQIQPGTWHRFKAATDCHLIEVYWADTTRGLTEFCDPNDIERYDEGGINL